MNDTLTTFKWFWTDQDLEQETWLRGMAQRGLHLRNVQLLWRYTFSYGPVSDTVYRMATSDQAKKADYLQLMGDCGWEFVTSSDAWSYWQRCAACVGSSEIFSDVDSRSAQYERVTATYLCGLVGTAAGIAVLASSRTISPPIKITLVALYILAVACAVYRVIRLRRRIKQLRHGYCLQAKDY